MSTQKAVLTKFTGDVWGRRHHPSGTTGECSPIVRFAACARTARQTFHVTDPSALAWIGGQDPEHTLAGQNHFTPPNTRHWY